MLFGICLVLVSVIARNLSQTDRTHLVVGLLAKKDEPLSEIAFKALCNG